MAKQLGKLIKYRKCFKTLKIKILVHEIFFRNNMVSLKRRFKGKFGQIHVKMNNFIIVSLDHETVSDCN